MDNPLISVITPAYNYGHFISETLESVKNQTYANWECLIIDDGSTDNTKEIVSKYLSDSRFKYYYKQNGGLSSARNYGLKLAKGDYIQFLDSDDLIAKNKFESQLKFQNAENITYSDYAFFSQNKFWKYKRLSGYNGKITLASLICYWDRKFIIPIHSFIFPKALFRSASFTENLPAGEDFDFHIKWMKKGFEPIRTDNIAAFYRTSDSSMAKSCINMHTGFLAVLLKYLNDEELSLSVKCRLTCRLYETFTQILIDIASGKEKNILNKIIHHRSLANYGTKAAAFLAAYIFVSPIFIIRKIISYLAMDRSLIYMESNG